MEKLFHPFCKDMKKRLHQNHKCFLVQYIIELLCSISFQIAWVLVTGFRVHRDGLLMEGSGFLSHEQEMNGNFKKGEIVLKFDYHMLTLYLQIRRWLNISASELLVKTWNILDRIVQIHA